MAEIKRIHAVATRKPAATDANSGAGKAPPAEGALSAGGVTFTRPYVQESSSFANRLEVELMYADNELALIRAHILALQMRETDLQKVRDAALNGLGQLTDRPREH